MNLRDAIDRDEFIIDGRTLADGEIQAMDIDDLETLKMLISKKISGLSASLYAGGGKNAPKEWYMNRKLALSINQRVLTYANSLIKKRLREAGGVRGCFMDRAEELLPREEFERILSSARREMEKRGD
jgi:hypothetical protein